MLQTRDVAPLPAVAWQQALRETIDGVPPLILVGLLLVADGQVRSVDIQIDVVVAGDAPAALLSRRHTLKLHLGIAALLPHLARRGQAVDPPVHVHRPQQRDGHGCTGSLELPLINRRSARTSPLLIRRSVMN